MIENNNRCFGKEFQGYNSLEGLVAITGIGFRIPSGDTKKSIQTPSELWKNLVNGFDAIIEPKERWSENFYKLGEFNNYNAAVLPLDEWKQFDPLFFGINPSEVSNIDPQQRLLLKCTWEALEDSKIDPISIRNSNSSVFIGCSTTDYTHININRNEVKTNLFGSSIHSISNRISYCFNLSGSSITLDTACSSSLNAILLGYESIKNKKSTVSIVGGVNILLESSVAKSFSYLNMLSKSTGRCMTFDEEADGFVRGECAAILILKDLKEAIKDGNNIYCVINGGNSNVDGNGLKDKQNFYSPSSISQAENIKLALLSTNGRVKTSDIKYCEAHGTGTPTGDPIECEGISMAFSNENSSINNSVENGNNNCKNSGDRIPLLIGSIKSNIGHCEASSGAASVIKCCLMFKHRQFVPNINFNTPNPSIKFKEWNLKVVTEVTPFNQEDQDISNTSIIVNNFGVTGSNVCLVLSQFNNNNNNNNSNNLTKNQNILIPFSANSSESLKLYQDSIIGNQEFQSNIQFEQFAQLQINYKSTSLYQKSVIIAKDWSSFNDLEKQVKYQTSSKKSSNILNSNRSNPVTIFVFCGQGAQYSSMGLDLYNNEATFRYWIDLIDNKLFKYYGYSVLEKLRTTKDQDSLLMNEQNIAQPSTIMLQIALFELYKYWGVKPSFIVGHSLGEISSAYCSGMIDLDTLCYLVYHRSLAQTKTNGSGKMLSINISSDQFKQRYSSKYPNIEIACYNSPSSIVIAGKECDLIEISNDLKENQEFSAMLGSLSSFHTSSQLVIKNDILELNIQSKSSNIPIFSTVTTKLFNNNDKEDLATSFNSNYVFDNIIKPVLFSETISNIFQHIETNQLGNNIVLIEIAPHPTLLFNLKQIIPNQSTYFNNGESISLYSPLHKKKNDIQEFQQTISQLYCQNGYNINFKSQLNPYQQNSSQTTTINMLPIYKWDDKQYWKEEKSIKNHSMNGPPINILGTSNKDFVPLNKSHQTFIDIQRPPFQYLKGHQVKNKYYFPGCGYISNLLNLYPSQDILINYLEFKSPLILNEGFNQCLQTNLIQTGKSDFKVLFHFKHPKTNEWIQSANGNIQVFNQNILTNNHKINIQELIETKCNLSKVSKEELYPHIKNKTGLNYSGVFQGTSECYLGENCSLSVISLESTKSEHQDDLLTSSSQSFFNTQILDCTLHGIMALVKDNCQLLFQNIEGFKYFSSNILINYKNNDKDIHSNIYVFSKVICKQNNSITASIIVTLFDGTILFEIDRVVCTSLTPIKDSLNIEYSNDLIYSYYLQPKESIIPSPFNFKQLHQSDQFISFETRKSNDSYYHIYLSSCLYISINNRNSKITLEEIQSNSIDQLYSKYNQSTKSSIKSSIVYSRLFKSTFETIKRYGYNQNYKSNKNQMINVVYKTLKKSTRITAKQLFPLENDDPDKDTQHSIFENGLLDRFYNSVDDIFKLNSLVGEIVKDSIKSFIGEKMVFKILEFGAGTSSLSKIVLNKINSLIEENPLLFEIDIEYTWSDISSVFISDAKNQLSHINKKVNIIYKTLDIEDAFVDNKKLKSSYYDIVIMSNVLHVVKDVRFSIDQIYKILSPNGHLLFVEPKYESLINKTIFGIFEQWWSFEDTDLRTDSCLLSVEAWYNLLPNHNFKDTIITNNSNHSILIHTRKSSIIEEHQNNNSCSSYDQIIIYYNRSGDSISKRLSKIIKSNNKSSKINKISTIGEFNELITSIPITDNSILYFIKSTDQLNLDNFKLITMEYIQIAQTLIEHNSKCKVVLITCNSTSINYLSSSIIGAARYFIEFPTLQQTILDFDSTSIQNKDILSSIGSLISPNQEYIIKDNKVYYERVKKESNISNTFKSNSYEDNDYYIKLDLNLEYQLKSKVKTLQPDDVEVKVVSSGINYKDYLIYSGIVVGVPNEFGLEFSGIITRIGNNCSKSFKVGDQVYGMGSDSTSSHIIVNQQVLCHKPSNISHSQAASIPAVYLTSLHSIYNIGKIEKNETILIHSATGGVGLSALELLKWKGHKSAVFVTVGSNEKKQFLIDRYGDFISGIYSTRNIDYSNQIKIRLKELGYQDKEGVDLILNTLSSDFMESNFKCLGVGGRIVDLSITHLNSNEYINNNNFKFNCGYHNVELQRIHHHNLKKHLTLISKAIESGKLNLIPIIEYSNINVKEAIEYINQRKHIGKIIINMDTDILGQLINNRKSSDEIILKSNYEINQNLIGRNILVTGQSGIILIILKWIIKYSTSIENIIVLSKSSIKWELQLLINQSKHIKFHFKSIDIGDSELVDNTITQILLDNPSITNIESIFHFAFTHIACEMNEIEMKHLDISHNSKTLGAINLHNQSIKRGWKLSNFILASSITSIFGSNKQCSYVTANCIFDSFSKYRKSIGLPSICINFGALESGFVNRNESVGIMLNSQGINIISNNLVLGLLDLSIQNQDISTNLLASKFSFDTLISNFIVPDLKFDFLINCIESKKRSSNNNDKSKLNIQEVIIDKISEFLSIESSKINTDLKISDYGADSLTVVSFKNWIDKEFLANIITIQEIQNNSLDSIIQIVKNNFESKSKKIQDTVNKTNTLVFDRTKINESINWNKQLKLKEIHTNNSTPLDDARNFNNILLKNSTGYLGIHILFSLLQNTNCSTVYCTSPQSLIIDQLKQYQLFNQISQNHLIKIKSLQEIFNGFNLSKDQFGLSNQDYLLLSKDIGVIIFNFDDSKSTLSKQADCDLNEIKSIKEIIKFSKNLNKKPIINLSSIYVFISNSNILNNQNDESELPEFNDIDKLPNNYLKCQLTIEHILKNASTKYNIPTTIIRAPLLFANRNTFLGNENDVSLLYLQSCVSLGYYPTLSNIKFPTITIEFLLNTISNLIYNNNNNHTKSDNNNLFKIHNLYSSTTIITSNQINTILEKEFQCKSMNDIYQWYNLLEASKHESCIKYHQLNESYFEYIDLEIYKTNNNNDLITSDNTLNYIINDQMIINHLNKFFNK